MNLKQKLIVTKPSENSGSSSSNRFDYQKNWSLCKMLDLYNSGRDFVITFEYHDDIIVLNSKENPTQIKFYQVKTKKSRNWTIQDMVRIKKDAKNSILGKLYFNKINFSNETESLHFVSNATFSMGLLDKEAKSTSLKKICCSKLSTNEKQKIKECLKKEHNILESSFFSKTKMFFEVDNLTIKHHVELSRDKLSIFIETNFPTIEYKITPIYKTIFDEIRLKSNYEDDINSFQDLMEKKSISRGDLQKMLSSINKGDNFREIGNSIVTRLNIERVSPNFIREFNSNWKRLEIDRLNKSNLQLKQILLYIEKIIKNLTDEEFNTNLVDCLNIIKCKINMKSLANSFYDDKYIDTIILYKIWIK